MSSVNWQKSSFSSERDECIEIGLLDGALAIRESDDPNVILTTASAPLRALLASTQAGKFDLPIE
ncbi:DUF397 domain-containing protein [Streptomyces sp. MST-110588]|uniref:DUF397 domain-containing protein n=1 Tax=Streptomyces sp. MST-110588 TaxID=2833628 RepID=UPI001F5DD8C8|nr:DUF397 domain-containing protein [Streptomyces sp. MST-110588]UNO40372.1 DUF397 domain-containing protein [Streptomyces sp. MST-110588]